MYVFTMVSVGQPTNGSKVVLFTCRQAILEMTIRWSIKYRSLENKLVGTSNKNKHLFSLKKTYQPQWLMIVMMDDVWCFFCVFAFSDYIDVVRILQY